MVDEEVEKSELPKHLKLETYTEKPSFQAVGNVFPKPPHIIRIIFLVPTISMHIDFLPTLPKSKNLTFESNASFQQSQNDPRGLY